MIFDLDATIIMLIMGLAVMFLCSVFCVRTLYNKSIKKKKERENSYNVMKNSIVPVKMVMVDVLIYKRRQNDSYNYYCYPIMRDLSDGRLYVSFKNYSYGGYSCRCFDKLLPGQNFKTIIYSAGGREINFGDVANCYVNRKLGYLSSTEKKVIIDNWKYNYFGMTKDIHILGISLGHYDLLNVTSESFLDDVNNIILFEGIIDFDV